MKKILAAALAASMVGAALAVSSFAYDPVTFDVPKAVAAPTIDGKFGDGEWENALEVSMEPDILFWVVDADPQIASAKYYFMWDDEALYYIADVTDNSTPDIVPPYGDMLNSGDGIQFCVWGPTGGPAGEGATNLFFSLHPKTDSGEADACEHFNIAAQIANDTYGAKIASTFSGDSYIVEGSIPWSVFHTIYTNGFTDDIKGEVGQKIVISACIMEANGGDQSLGTRTGWMNFDEADTFVLTDAVAGHVEEPEPEPETEAPAPAPAETEAPAPAETAAPVAETAAPVAAAAPAAAAPAAQTGDMTALAVVAAVAVIGTAIVVKRK